MGAERAATSSVVVPMLMKSELLLEMSRAAVAPIARFSSAAINRRASYARFATPEATVAPPCTRVMSSRCSQRSFRSFANRLRGDVEADGEIVHAHSALDTSQAHDLALPRSQEPLPAVESLGEHGRRGADPYAGRDGSASAPRTSRTRRGATTGR